MQINLTGDIVAIIEGLESLADQLDIQLHNEGYPIEVKQRAGPITISNNGGKGEIYFQEKIHFFRAIGLWIEQYQKIGEFSLSEQPQFQTSGVMLDVSRNAVLKVEEVQRLLRHMAIMGLNVAMLYTEDTYEIPDYPYFGYMRGRYTEEELRQCDEYADLFGIEMIPCIQTLGHLAMALKWGYAQEIRDTYDILLAGNPKTYQFIENMMAAASRPFKSKRIHVGMDEAHQLGLGHFLKQNGYKNRFDIMNQHLEEVVSIADRLGLSPMIWSDMYFRLGSKEGNIMTLTHAFPKMQRSPSLPMFNWFIGITIMMMKNFTEASLKSIQSWEGIRCLLAVHGLGMESLPITAGLLKQLNRLYQPAKRKGFKKSLQHYGVTMVLKPHLQRHCQSCSFLLNIPTKKQLVWSGSENVFYFVRAVI